MSGFLIIALLLCLHKDGSYRATAWDDADFFSYCPPSWCSKNGLEIRYPFRLESSNTSSLCGVPCMNLACSGDDTILVRPPAVIPYKVTTIDYKRGTLTISPRVDDSSPSCGQKFMSVALHHSAVKINREDPCPQLRQLEYAVTVSCLTKFTPSDDAAKYIFGPISCLSNQSHFSYLVDGSADQSVLPLDCKVVPDSFFPMRDDPSLTFKERAEAILNFSETTLYWYYYGGGDVRNNCTRCEAHGGRRCGFSSQSNQTSCINHGIISNWWKPYNYMARYIRSTHNVKLHLISSTMCSFEIS